MKLFGGKSKKGKAYITAQRKREGYHQFTRIFDGKKFKYHHFVPDARNQGPKKGESGSVEWLRIQAKQSRTKIRTVRLRTGWEVYYR